MILRQPPLDEVSETSSIFYLYLSHDI